MPSHEPEIACLAALARAAGRSTMTPDDLLAEITPILVGVPRNVAVAALAYAVGYLLTNHAAPEVESALREITIRAQAHGMVKGAADR